MLQNNLNEVGLVPLALSTANQSKLIVPANLLEKFNNKSNATASGVVDDPVDRNNKDWVPFCIPPDELVTNVADDFVVLVPVVTDVPDPIIPTLLQFDAPIPLVKLLAQFDISAKF
jgi:hypothetical protein